MRDRTQQAILNSEAFWGSPRGSAEIHEQLDHEVVDLEDDVEYDVGLTAEEINLNTLRFESRVGGLGVEGCFTDDV